MKKRFLILVLSLCVIAKSEVAHSTSVSMTQNIAEAGSLKIGFQNNRVYIKGVAPRKANKALYVIVESVNDNRDARVAAQKCLTSSLIAKTFNSMLRSNYRVSINIKKISSSGRWQEHLSCSIVSN